MSNFDSSTNLLLIVEGIVKIGVVYVVLNEILSWNDFDFFFVQNYRVYIFFTSDRCQRSFWHIWRSFETCLTWKLKKNQKMPLTQKLRFF